MFRTLTREFDLFSWGKITAFSGQNMTSNKPFSNFNILLLIRHKKVQHPLLLILGSPTKGLHQKQKECSHLKSKHFRFTL